MPTSTASLSLSRGGNRANNNAATGQATAQSTATASSSAAPPWRRTSRQESTNSATPTQAASSSGRKETSIAPPPPPPPPPPSMGPPLPPPPPPPSMASLPSQNKEATVKLEQIRKTPRKRPDWASMMKEIESGKKLKRVQTNDRSQPILPKSKAKGKVVHGQTLPITTCSDDTGIDGDMNTKEVFVYDSEKPTVANQILLEIQRGVRLKKAQCNDRSRPNLNGLGVFRRQLSTVDQPEQQDAAPSPLIEPEEDYDDIDKVRDDLQSTKQLLEIELKNRIKIDTENARLQNEIRRLKEELSKKPQAPPAPAASAPTPVPVQSAAPLRKSSSSLNHGLSKSTSRMLLAARKAKKAAGSDDDEDDSDEEIDFGELEAVEEEMNALRGQAELARKTAEEFESRYKETSQKLVTTQAEMEDLEMKVTVLQKKLRRAQAGNGIEEAETTEIGTQTDPMKLPTPPPQPLPPSRSYSKRDMRRQMSRQDSRTSNLSSTGGGAGESGEEDEEGEDEDPLKAQKRELKMLLSRLRSAKDKEKATANERIAMKQQLRKFRSDLKDEKKKYVQLKKEVDGMAGMMNDLGDDEKVEVVVEEIEVTDSEEEEEEVEEEEEEDEESEESEDAEEEEEEESEEDTESDEFDTRVEKLSERLRNHDNYLNTLKKANYLLKSKVDKWQEELRKERGRYKALEIELNTCLAELG